MSASIHLPSLIVRSLPWILGFLLAHALPTSMIGDRWATEVHAGDDGYHDPYDLSHGDASALLENPLEPRYDIAIATFAVGLVLLTIYAGTQGYLDDVPIAQVRDRSFQETIRFKNLRGNVTCPSCPKNLLT